MTEMTLSTTRSAPALEGARDGIQRGWSALGRAGQAVILAAALVATFGAMAAAMTNSGVCAGDPGLDAASVSEIMPPVTA